MRQHGMYVAPLIIAPAENAASRHRLEAQPQCFAEGAGTLSSAAALCRARTCERCRTLTVLRFAP